MIRTTLAAIFSVLLLAGCQTTSGPPDPDSFTRADLLHGFEKSAYGWEFSSDERNFIVRYDEPLRILLIREENDGLASASFNRVVGFIRDLYRPPEIASVEVVNLADTSRELVRGANLVVFAVGARAYEAVHERLTRNHLKDGRAHIAELFFFNRCGGFISSKNGRIVRATVMLDVDQNRNTAQHRELDECMAEEILQSLGLPNDHDSLAWSMFNDNNEVYWPGDFDRLLLSMLYSDELTPGMPKAEADERLPTIIDRLWPAYQAAILRRNSRSG